MSSTLLYADSLVRVTEDAIVFSHYYYPSGSAKRVSFDEIGFITVHDCTFWTGKWRIWGTGDFVTWFPRDRHRSSRDKVFYLTKKQGTIRIGFTVEDSAAVAKLLRDRGLLSR